MYKLYRRNLPKVNVSIAKEQQRFNQIHHAKRDYERFFIVLLIIHPSKETNFLLCEMQILQHISSDNYSRF